MSGVYLEYYGLTEAPFDITPNPRFLFYSAKHREAFNHLLYGIRERKGFVQLTGEVGAGKTTLCRAVLEHLEGHYSTALILNPVMSSDELMKGIATEFGLNVRGFDRLDTIAALNQFLLHQVEHGKDSVLIIDESQDLTDDLIEQVRLLSNLETDTHKLLQIVLLGQPELRDRLNNPRLRQLRQRITVRYHLVPLNRFEVNQYVQHRLELSGANGRPYFTGPALWRIYRYSGGIPRLVNAVCDKALLAGFVHQTDRINFSMIGRAIRELEGEDQRVSLINDALKRAKHAQKHASAASPGDLPLKPVDPASIRRDELPILLIIGLFIVLGVTALVVTFFLIRRGQFHAAETALTEPAASTAAPVPKPMATPAPTPAAPAPAPQAAPVVAPATPAAPPVTPTVAGPAKQPLPRLQGIFFSPSRPSAVLDGKTVYIGGHVSDFQVLAVAHDSVTIARPGQTNVLTLPQ